MIKSRVIRWAGFVARMGEGDVLTGCWWGKLRESEHLEDLVADGRITDKWIFKK